MNGAERRSRAGPGIEDWRRVVRDALKGRDSSLLNSHTRDGVVIEPLYERKRDAVSLPGRGARPWTVVQLVDDSDPDAANRQALADLDGGATGLSLRLAGSPLASEHGLSAEAAALRTALAGIDLTAVHVRLEPHADCLSAAAWLREAVERSGTVPELTDIAFGLDPVAVVARRGAAAAPDPGQFAARIRELSAARFRGPFAMLDGRLFYEAGATEGQELAAILAAAAWWLRALDAAGRGPAESLGPLGASIAVDRDQFLSIAKLRALRLLWARLQELCGSPRGPLSIHAETGRRMLTRADPTTNLLRNTLAAFAAGVGGADSIAVLPHTAALGRPDGNARALARNIQHLMIEEAQIFRVADPGAGSGAIEALTDALAERAWDEFQAIEREGGIIASLSAGAFRSRIAEARAALRKETAVGATPLVGATIYPAPGGAAAGEFAGDEVLAEFDLAPVRLEELARAAA
ncbi:MAG: methylmalonyl-CoA mutase family protein [Propylenella sp.]